jgi:hypothetical protein
MKDIDEVFLLKNTDEEVVRRMIRPMDEVEFKAWLRIGADFEDSGKYSKESLVKVLEFIYGIEEFSDKEMILLNLLSAAE